MKLKDIPDIEEILEYIAKLGKNVFIPFNCEDFRWNCTLAKIFHEYDILDWHSCVEHYRHRKACKLDTQIYALHAIAEIETDIAELRKTCKWQRERIEHLEMSPNPAAPFAKQTGRASVGGVATDARTSIFSLNGRIS